MWFCGLYYSLPNDDLKQDGCDYYIAACIASVFDNNKSTYLNLKDNRQTNKCQMLVMYPVGHIGYFFLFPNSLCSFLFYLKATFLQHIFFLFLQLDCFLFYFSVY